MRHNNSVENNVYNDFTTTPTNKYKSCLYIKKPVFCSCKYMPIKKVIFANESYKSPQKYSQMTRPVSILSKTDGKIYPYKTFKYTTKTELGKKYRYGEKVDEKDNYILYCSGLGTEVDERCKDMQRKKLSFTESHSPIKIKTKSNYEIGSINETDELNCTDANYRYKEIKNFKENNYPEKKSTMTHKVFNSPLKFNPINLKKKFGDKKLFGSSQKARILKNSYSNNNLFNKYNLNIAQKNAGIRNLKFNESKQYDEKKLFSEKKIYSGKTLLAPRIINKTKSQTNKKYGNTTQKVKTYQKSTKDCDYLIKVTTTSTEIPIRDTDEGFCIKKNATSYNCNNVNKKNFNVYNSNEKYHNNCLSDMNKVNKTCYKVIKSPIKRKCYVMKKKEESIKQIFCPIHGKSTWLCTKIS